jgi:hypothetical protein
MPTCDEIMARDTAAKEDNWPDHGRHFQPNRDCLHCCQAMGWPTLAERNTPPPPPVLTDADETALYLHHALNDLRRALASAKSGGLTDVAELLVEQQNALEATWDMLKLSQPIPF